MLYRQDNNLKVCYIQLLRIQITFQVILMEVEYLSTSYLPSTDLLDYDLELNQMWFNSYSNYSCRLGSLFVLESLADCFQQLNLN